ncbi:hypothetical protein G6F46_003462 [Rhizopus delemar]|uniref:Complex 1 LYR protein domain-containing protein n=3 Tax=Rhizopus TaxID=4842 RepID=I1CR23_RHIO9|nr:hypothetical protein RO3G_15614 [Rhizopus delemar RA 99-880]KAG1054892.1 hypothetical protein G6F43_003113 [Rhizopus delemar]KAG1548460.1 hypothetical protein G6F51_003650 [Rhizopus arrhizus]KAG1463533.1 hypothetical protein G6F55_002332 [Rhizopus delemar]KAG1501614.1 hypothetical protein G6F54_002917 [Rhizopus delemar]|eukprot:EIE90903.1 hypothetical protein RO3G_15614 [Rhizopus delemar RA 99-880]
MSSNQVLSLYRQFLRYGNKFASYNFRDYTIRRSRDGFRANMNETNPEKLAALIEKAKYDLAALKRQATISQMYTKGEHLVVEKHP